MHPLWGSHNAPLYPTELQRNPLCINSFPHPAVRVRAKARKIIQG
jgi:hypothetical protein